MTNMSAGLQPHTQEAIPGWQGLLFVYAVLLLPVLFSLLVGVNLLVWSRSRINYVFIFGELRLCIKGLRGLRIRRARHTYSA